MPCYDLPREGRGASLLSTWSKLMSRAPVRNATRVPRSRRRSARVGGRVLAVTAALLAVTTACQDRGQTVPGSIRRFDRSTSCQTRGPAPREAGGTCAHPAP